MKQQSSINLLSVIIVAIIPWLYLAMIWNQLPDTIALHFGISGQPDKFGPKNNILLIPAILSAKIILVYLLLQWIVKKRKEKIANAGGLLVKLSVVLAFFLSGVSLLLLYWTLKGKVTGLPLIMAGVGLLLAFVGNNLYSIKPNPYAGFRVSWTLNNEEIWRATHHFSSRVWFFGGIILAKAALLLTVPLMFYVYFSVLLLMFAIPFFYSYNLYKKSKNQHHV